MYPYNTQICGGPFRCPPGTTEQYTTETVRSIHFIDRVLITDYIYRECVDSHGNVIDRQLVRTINRGFEERD